MVLGRQYKYHSYKYSLRFRHHYYHKISLSTRKNRKEKSGERPIRHKYNIHKHIEVPRETDQVEQEQVDKDTNLSHPKLDIQKFIIDTIW
ncbi:MAG: hypothetical protein EZS28_030795 [Streblomastix strix]|uniref:Uncharacterized protein n=1 Tax=Streblomastix strix TaxID=222440 RepID=A0A5J4UTD3_9EUKA|nr:MAG: hypothetical protein EZS28_030795 [Streblomastix strix]